MTDLQKKYYEVSREYVEQEKLNEDVIGIIVSGSMIHSTIDKNSDIDIYVILDSKCDYRERGNIWIRGIEVEYFKNPPLQVKSYFETEKKSPHTAHLLAFGEVVYSKSDVIDELVAKAKSIIKEAPPKLNAFEIEFEKYFMDDYSKDLEDALLNQDLVGTSIIRNKIINRSIDIFCKIHQIRRGKDKRLRSQIELLDSSFFNKIEKAFSENWDKMASIEALRIATENLLGGRRSKEWKLRSQLVL